MFRAKAEILLERRELTALMFYIGKTTLTLPRKYPKILHVLIMKPS
jgi:hypothetical protein